jgi:hypothetical protein
VTLSAGALSFLRQKNITEATALHWGVQADDNLIVLPCRDEEGRDIGQVHRRIDRGTFGEGRRFRWRPQWYPQGFHLDFCELFLFGLYQRESGPCLLVEGFFDAMRLWDAGYRNVFAYNGHALSTYQWSLLRGKHEDVGLLPDGDSAGRALFERTDFPKEHHYAFFRLPDTKDPDELSNSELENLLGPPPFWGKVPCEVRSCR